MDDDRTITFSFTEVDFETHCGIKFKGKFVADELMLAAGHLLDHVWSEMPLSLDVKNKLRDTIKELCKAKLLNDEDIENASKNYN